MCIGVWLHTFVYFYLSTILFERLSTNAKNETFPEKEYWFLSGNNEMGRMIRKKDWNNTPLGNPELWPASLRTMVSVILNNPLAMYIAWGKEYTQIYNDGFQQLLATSKRTGALGASAEITFADTWDTIKPKLEKVMEGDSIHETDVIVPLVDNGFTHKCYFDLACSPIKNEEGNAGGILVTVIEITNKQKVEEELKDAKERMEYATHAADIATWVFDPQNETFVCDKLLKDWFGLPEAEAFPLELAMEKLIPKDKEPVQNAIEQSLQYSHGFIDHECTIVHPQTKQSRIIRVKGKAVFNKDKIAYKLYGILQDITSETLTQRSIKESSDNYRMMIQQAPFSIAVLRGPDYIVEVVNDKALELWQRKREDVMGMPIMDAMPELADQGIKELLDEVYKTGKTFSATEMPVQILKNNRLQETFINFNYQALKNTEAETKGILAMGMNVTALVKARRQVEESEKLLRSIVENSPFPIGVYIGKEMKIKLANQAILDIWGKGNEVIGKLYTDTLPELTNQNVFEQLEKVYSTGIPFHARNQQIDLLLDNRMQTFYFNYSFTPLFNLEGQVYGVMNTGADVTDLVNAIQKAEKSEEQLRIALAGGELGTFDYYPLEKKLVWSDKTKELFGFPADSEIDYETYMQALYSEDLDNSVALAQNRFPLNEDGLYELEYRTVGIKDDKVRWLKSKGKVTYNEQGVPARFTGVVQEITKLKEAEAERIKVEQELKESEARLRMFADSMPQIVWAAGADGKLTYINKAFYSYSGLSVSDKIEEEWIAIIHPEDRKETLDKWEASYESGCEFSIEHRFKNYHGEYRWQLTRAVPIKDSEGKVQTWVATSTDIQEIKELDQQKDHFISIASHELKTPITSIKGYIQILESIYSESDDAFLKKSLSTVDKQIVKLTNLISDLLDLSKLKLGNLHLLKESFNMNELIEEVVEEMRLVKKDYTIDVALHTDAEVVADRERIAQVLVNFLTNAIKYSPQNKLIKVKSVLKDNSFKVIVTDHGIGISKQSQEKIFERFYRVEGANEKTYPGFGIGLFISAEIIQRHNGEIGVESVPGKGSSFFFSLPVK